MKTQRILIVIVAIFFVALFCGAKTKTGTPKSFSTAKKHIYEMYRDHPLTFYCGCAFRKDKTIDATQCGYVRKSSRQEYRVNVEHVVPAKAFGGNLNCWTAARKVCGKKGGRKCCRKTNTKFKRMEGDMHNLRLTVLELNNLRGNKPFGIIPGEKREFGKCDFEIEKKGVAEPREAIRGDIARTYFYMEGQYDIKLLTEAERRVFTKWSKEDPVDKWECERNGRIEAIQGNGNPYIENNCKKFGF